MSGSRDPCWVRGATAGFEFCTGCRRSYEWRGDDEGREEHERTCWSATGTTLAARTLTAEEVGAASAAARMLVGDLSEALKDTGVLIAVLHGTAERAVARWAIGDLGVRFSAALEKLLAMREAVRGSDASPASDPSQELP